MTSSDLKLIVLTEESEFMSVNVIAPPPNGRTYPLSFGHLPVLQGVTRSAARASAQALSLTQKSKIRQEGERKRVEGKECPERKTDWEKERGGMSDFAAVFFLPSLLVPRGVPLWLTQSCRKKNMKLCGTSWTPSPTHIIYYTSRRAT